MKNRYALLALPILIGGLFLFTQKDSFRGLFSPATTTLRVPGAPGEENQELRKRRNLAMLADPSTGQIPAGIAYREQRFAEHLPLAVAARGLAPEWQSRGPWNVGGRTRALAIDVTDEQHLLAGGVSGGVWESTDGGQSWVRRTPMSAHPGVVSIAQDTRPGHTDTWYYISGEIFGTSASGGGSFYLGDGMFKSTDNGQNWTPIGSTDNGNASSFTDVWQSGWRVVTDPTAPEGQNIVYAATYGCIWRSTNGGSTWTAVRGSANATQPSYFTDVTITSTGVLYATLSSEGSQKGIWRSANGTTWTQILPATGFPAEYDRVVIGVNPDNENEVWFLGSTPGAGFYNNYLDSDNWSSLWKYTYVSGDGSGAGGQWEDRSQNLPSTGTQFDRFAIQGGYDLVVKVQPGTGNVFVGGTNLYRSTDAFTTNTNTTQIGGYKIGTDLPFFEIYANQHPDQHDCLFLPSNPNVLLTASDGGLHRTEDCLAPTVVWNPLNRGYQTTQFYTAIFEKSTPGDATLIGGLQDNGNFFSNSTDPTATWVQTVNGDGAFGAIPDGKPFYVLSIQQGRVVKCNIDNQGVVTAFRRFDPIGVKKDDYQFINPLALDPADQNVLYLPAGRRFFRQDDLAGIQLTGEWDSIAQGWTQFPDTLVAINDANAEHQFSALGVSQTDHRVYLGTTRNKLFRVDNANVGAPALTAIPSPVTSGTAYVNCLAVDPTNSSRVVAVFSNYGVYSLWLSENAGQNWIKVGGNLEANVAGTGDGPSIRWVSILPFADGTRKYFCGTSVGLFSADTLLLHATGQPGTQWVRESADLIGSSVVTYVDVRPSDGLVVAATHGVGMFSAYFSPASSGQEPSNSRVQVKVSPNPTANVASFFWGENAPGQQPVALRLFDTQGRLVRTAQWSGQRGDVDLADLSGGTYWYQLRGPGWLHSGQVVKQ